MKLKLLTKQVVDEERNYKAIREKITALKKVNKRKRSIRTRK